MTSISYDDIFAYFLGEINDIELINLEESLVYQVMCEYLHKAIAKPYVKKLFSNIEFDDEVLTLNYQLKRETEVDFILDIIAKGMVVEWLQRQVKDRTNIAQFFGGKEEKFFAQSNHLSELRALLKDTRLEQRNLINNYGYINNSYIGE